MQIKGYYFITDSHLSLKGNLHDVKAALCAGVSVIQYRNKCASTREMYQEAFILRKLCSHKALFIINDRVDIALAVNADGVHIGQSDVPYAVARRLLGKKKIIGVTVHSLKEAIAVQRQGADYLGVSPIFKTTTKKDAGRPEGVALIRSIKKSTVIPVVAIGGINLFNGSKVVAAGAEALCAISAVVKRKDIKKEITRFQKLFR